MRSLFDLWDEQVILDEYRAELMMLMESNEEGEEYYDEYHEDDGN